MNGETTLASNDPAISEAQRDQARDRIRDHARKEAARIDRLSRVRGFVLGARDDLLVALAVVTGMAAANPGRSAILVAEIEDRELRWPLASSRVVVGPHRMCT